VLRHAKVFIEDKSFDLVIGIDSPNAAVIAIPCIEIGKR